MNFITIKIKRFIPGGIKTMDGEERKSKQRGWIDVSSQLVLTYCL
jgi:hypothetical protein